MLYCRSYRLLAGVVLYVVALVIWNYIEYFYQPIEEEVRETLENERVSGGGGQLSRVSTACLQHNRCWHRPSATAKRWTASCPSCPTPLLAT